MSLLSPVHLSGDQSNTFFILINFHLPLDVDKETKHHNSITDD